jgi:hypothetical protein
LPIQHGGAQRASLGFPIRRMATWWRSPRLWLSALALALLAPFAPTPLTLPSTVVAASGCGQWQSKVHPPTSIRVLRTASGRVEEVQFATYVATVMASGEWPSWLPRAALEVGATAVKQYAWYYLLDGHHRASYRTSAGDCYDVRDDTSDQLYRPETADPTQKQLEALAVTWGLSLRKNDHFFLTGYRYGSDVGCARDTDGWRLYEQSVERCAREGWSRDRILEAYFAPSLRSVWEPGSEAPASERGDRRAPVVFAPRVRLRRGSTLGEATGQLRWDGADAGSGVAAYRVEQRTGSGDWVGLELARPKARKLKVTLDPGRPSQFRVQALDDAGNLSEWVSSSAVTPKIRETEAARMGGRWRLVRQAQASGGSLRSARRSGATLSFGFTGSAVGIVAPTGPGHGVMRIRVAGAVVARIDLGRMPEGDQQLVWSRDWPTARARRIGVVVTKTPKGSSVDVDAFIVLR